MAKHGERVDVGVAILGPAYSSSFFAFASSRSFSLSPSLCLCSLLLSLSDHDTLFHCMRTTHSSLLLLPASTHLVNGLQSFSCLSQSSSPSSKP